MDSPFADHLDSTYTPSDDEIPLIQTLLQRQVDAVASLDSKIKAVEDTLVALQAQRETANDFIWKHRALIAPIKRLPLDILSTIFLACLPPIESWKASMSRNHQAVVISHVCRQWRRLAFDTPLLWSRIQLILPYVSLDPYYPPYHLVNEDVDVNNEAASLFHSAVQRLHDITTVWLARSKGCPLSIFMKASEGGDEGFVVSQSLKSSILKTLKTLVDLLCSQSTRWEEVEFRFAVQGSSPHESQLSRLLFLAPQDVPILRKVSITVNPLDSFESPIHTNPLVDPPSFWDDVTLGTVHGQALQALKLACPKVVTKLNTLRVNWAGLTELSLRPYLWGPSGRKGGVHLTVEEALALLRLCPNLKRCNLAIANATIQPPPPALWPTLNATLSMSAQEDRPVCRLPHLHSLVLREDSRTDSLAGSLDLPSLRFFAQNSTIFWPRPPQGPLSDPEEEIAWLEIPLAGWVRRFGHAITSLDFKHVGVPQSAVEQCLEELPNLISLKIRSPFSESWNLTLPWGVASDRDSFLRRLTPNIKVIEEGNTVILNSAGCLCPKLEDLNLISSSNSGPVQLVFTEKGVVDFLTGRAQASLDVVQEMCRVSKLRCVRVGLIRPKTMDIEQELSRRGVNVEGLVREWNYPPTRPRSYLRTPAVNDFFESVDEFLDM